MKISFGKLTPYNVIINGKMCSAKNKGSRKELNDVARVFTETLSNPKKCNTPELQKVRSIFYDNVDDYWIAEDNGKCGSPGSDKIKNLPLYGDRRYIVSGGNDIKRIDDIRDKVMRKEFGLYGSERIDALRNFTDEIETRILLKEFRETPKTLNIYVDRDYSGKTLAEKYKIKDISFK